MVKLSELFFTNLYIFGGAFILALAGFCYRSKCSNVNLCYGCIKFERDIAIDYKEDKLNGLPSTEMQPQGRRVLATSENQEFDL